jgi:hypothetical protein
MAKVYNLSTAPKEFIDKVVNATEGKPGGEILLNTFFKLEQKKRETSTKQNTSTKTKKNETSVKKVDKKMLNAKRKGKSYSILNTAMGLTDTVKTKKKTLLG